MYFKRHRFDLHYAAKSLAIQGTHGNTFGSWKTEGDDDRAVGRHHDKTLFKADFGDTGPED